MLGGFPSEAVYATGMSCLLLHVISPDGGVATAAADDLAGQHGVKLTLKNGDAAMVRFGDATPSASIDWTRANGTSVTTGPRTMVVQALPLMR